MIIQIPELSEGTSELSFAIEPDTLLKHLQAVDQLYTTRGKPGDVVLKVSRFDENIVVRGTIRFDFRFQCARCLTERLGDEAIALDWTLVPKAQMYAEDLSDDEERELTEEDLDVSFYEGEELDLGDLAREAILLELPPRPRCPVDECEYRDYSAPSRAAAAAGAFDEDADEDEKAIDPRWAPLARLKGQLSDD